jgi:hypothetical protein
VGRDGGRGRRGVRGVCRPAAGVRAAVDRLRRGVTRRRQIPRRSSRECQR